MFCPTTSSPNAFVLLSLQNGMLQISVLLSQNLRILEHRVVNQTASFMRAGMLSVLHCFPGSMIGQIRLPRPLKRREN